jgi:glycosyltransferase involved in cell wall biosynthesis
MRGQRQSWKAEGLMSEGPALSWEAAEEEDADEAASADDADHLAGGDVAGGAASGPPDRDAGGDRLPWSLKYLVDEDGADTGFTMLRGAINAPQRSAFEKMIVDHRIVGFTHFGRWPLFQSAYSRAEARRNPTDGWNRPDVESCEAWFHCFRQPDRCLPPDKPRFLLSGSDFVDITHVQETAYGERVPAKRWDVVYCCLPNWHNEIRKNWSLALRCIEVLVHELDLTVLLVGRCGSADVLRHPNVEVRPPLGWDDLIRSTARARIAFLPNSIDPSPRVLTEALALDVPVLVSSEILGGWKYVNAETGSFFDDESDVARQAELLLCGSHRPLAWLSEHSGRQNAARRLADHLRTLGGADGLSYALPRNEPPAP